MCVQVEEFIAQLGISIVSPVTESDEKQSPAKRKKLKTAKMQHDEHLRDGDLAQRVEKDVSETSKKRKDSKLQHNEVTSTTTKAVDWISNYRPRKYLLVKPGGKWYGERVS